MIDRETTIVVPCYNEAGRFPADAFREFADAVPCVRFLFVNDGSTDGTHFILRRLACAVPDRFECVDQGRNQGKAESVRIGILRALARGGRYVGYWDADLATPLSEIPRFIETLDAHPDREVCFGARVQLLGRAIRRQTYRHYVGRLFATAASLALRLPIYDTQCGAKLFRASPDMHALFAKPFLGRWSFDIEIIARLTEQRAGVRGRTPFDVIYELPLDEWRDIDGSHLTLADFVKALVDLGRIRRRYLRHSNSTNSFRTVMGGQLTRR